MCHSCRIRVVRQNIFPENMWVFMKFKKISLLPRKRFWHAYFIAWITSLISILLSIAPFFWTEVVYDPTIAVLTATLVCLIWYTYFTYRAVNNEPMTQLDFGFGYQKEPVATLSLDTQNQRNHNVLCVIHFSIQTYRGEWPMPPPYTGQTDDQLHLKPGEAFHGSIHIQELIDSLPLDKRTVVVTAEGKWQDEVNEEGIIGPKNWSLDLQNQSMRRLYSKSELDAELLKMKTA